MTSVERINAEAGLGAVVAVVVVVVVDGGTGDSTSVSFRYCSVMGYEAVSWACQSWTAICCHTLGMNLQDSFVVVAFHHAI